MTILIETEFNLKDIVCNILDPEVHYAITAFKVDHADDGICTQPLVICTNSAGTQFAFFPYEIKHSNIIV